jgi:hypothetical protein
MLPNSVSRPASFESSGDPGPMFVIYMNVVGGGPHPLNFID